jgi:hypothetical protein
MSSNVDQNYPVLLVSDEGKKDVLFVHGFKTSDDRVHEIVDGLNALAPPVKPANIHVRRLAWNSVAARLEEDKPTKNKKALHAGVGYVLDAAGTREGSRTELINKQMQIFIESGQPLNFIAHSRGCRVLAEWLLSLDGAKLSDCRVALCHPDLSLDTMVKLREHGLPLDNVIVFDTSYDFATSSSGVLASVAGFSETEASRDIGPLAGAHCRLESTSHKDWLKDPNVGSVLGWFDSPPKTPSEGRMAKRARSSVVRRPSSVVRCLSSVVRRPSSVVRRPSSIVRRASSVVRRPSSDVHEFRGCFVAFFWGGPPGALSWPRLESL